jgi:hypothetical protein
VDAGSKGTVRRINFGVHNRERVALLGGTPQRGFLMLVCHTGSAPT